MTHVVSTPRAPVTTVSAARRRASASASASSRVRAPASKSERVERCAGRAAGAWLARPSARRVAAFAARVAAADADDSPKPRRRVRKISENRRAVAASESTAAAAKRPTADDEDEDDEDEDAAEEGTQLDLKEMYGDGQDGSWDDEEEMDYETMVKAARERRRRNPALNWRLVSLAAVD